MEETNAKLLLKPSPKSSSAFKREYPFPIIKNDVGENQNDPTWEYMEGYLQKDCVLVHSEEHMKLLYQKGFFGKGTKAKNAPQVCFNKQKTEHEKESNGDTEEVIDIEDSDDESSKLELEKESDDVEVVLSDSSSSSGIQQRARFKTPGLNDKESLQLTFQEAYFLSYGLGCLIVKDQDQPLNLARLWHKFCELTLDKRFPVMYTAYHHFRSKGWIVKCGHKYGSDYVLYKDGPPFYHATYAVLVKAVKEEGLREIGGNSQLTWGALSSLNRSTTTAGKGLIILYVIRTANVSENKISTPFCISQYEVEEVLVKRWVPSENREEHS